MQYSYAKFLLHIAIANTLTTVIGKVLRGMCIVRYNVEYEKKISSQNL